MKRVTNCHFFTTTFTKYWQLQKTLNLPFLRCLSLFFFSRKFCFSVVMRAEAQSVYARVIPKCLMILDLTLGYWQILAVMLLILELFFSNRVRNWGKTKTLPATIFLFVYFSLRYVTVICACSVFPFIVFEG